MPHATGTLHDRIAVVFDFDLTLGEGSVDVLLRNLDVEPERFRRECVQPLKDGGWDHALARFKALIDLSEARGGAVTRDLKAGAASRSA